MNAFDDPMTTAIIITLPHGEHGLTKDECKYAGFEADQTGQDVRIRGAGVVLAVHAHRHCRSPV